jgi:hypothetical protein
MCPPRAARSQQARRRNAHAKHERERAEAEIEEDGRAVLRADCLPVLADLGDRAPRRQRRCGVRQAEEHAVVPERRLHAEHLVGERGRRRVRLDRIAPRAVSTADGRAAGSPASRANSASTP